MLLPLQPGELDDQTVFQGSILDAEEAVLAMDVCEVTQSLLNHKCHVEELLNNEFSSQGL